MMLTDAVECPKCGALAGDGCHDRFGNLLPGYIHPSRLGRQKSGFIASPLSAAELAMQTPCPSCTALVGQPCVGYGNRLHGRRFTWQHRYDSLYRVAPDGVAFRRIGL